MKKSEYLDSMSALRAELDAAIASQKFDTLAGITAKMKSLETQYATQGETPIEWDRFENELNAELSRLNADAELVRQYTAIAKVLASIVPAQKAFRDLQISKFAPAFKALCEKFGVKPEQQTRANVVMTQEVEGAWHLHKFSAIVTKRAPRVAKLDENGKRVPKARGYVVITDAKLAHDEHAAIYAALKAANQAKAKLSMADIGNALLPCGVRGKDGKARPHFKLDGKGRESWANLLKPVYE